MRGRGVTARAAQHRCHGAARQAEHLQANAGLIWRCRRSRADQLCVVWRKRDVKK